MVTGKLVNWARSVRRTLDQYRAILAERNVALLLGAGVASEVGDWFNTVALISLSFRFSDSALGVGGMFADPHADAPAGPGSRRGAGRSPRRAKAVFVSQMAMAVIASSFALLVFSRSCGCSTCWSSCSKRSIASPAPPSWSS